MTLDEIISKLKIINTQLLKKYSSISQDKQKEVLARTAKVSEEYGELIDEILSSLELQRQNKLDKFQKENIEKEFGDVFNTLMLLGLALDIDVSKAIQSRLEQMYAQYSQ